MGTLAVRPLATTLLDAGVMDLPLDILDLGQCMQTICGWMRFSDGLVFLLSVPQKLLCVMI
jgi:hypothetical protein